MAAYKPVGVNEDSLFPPRVMAELDERYHSSADFPGFKNVTLKEYTDLVADGTVDPDVLYLITSDDPTIYTSDTWSGGNDTDLTGRTTDALSGGSSRSWAGHTAQFQILDSQLMAIGSGGSGSLAIPMTYSDYEASVEVSTLPTSTPGLMISIRQGLSSYFPGGDTGYGFRISIESGAVIASARAYSAGGVEVTDPNDLAKTTIEVGDKLSIRAFGPFVQWYMTRDSIEYPIFQLTEAEILSGRIVLTRVSATQPGAPGGGFGTVSIQAVTGPK